MLHLDAKSQGHKSRMGESEVNSTEDRGDPGETVTSRVRTSRPRGGAEPSVGGARVLAGNQKHPRKKWRIWSRMVFWIQFGYLAKLLDSDLILRIRSQEA